MSRKREYCKTYHLKEARAAIMHILENTAFGTIDKTDALPYLTGVTNVKPIETWGLDDEWNQWGNPNLDKLEDSLDLKNGYLMGLTDEQRRERISVAEELQDKLLAAEKAAFEEEMMEYENRLADKGRTEAAKAFEKLKLKPIEEQLENIETDTTATANGVDWLVTDRKKKAKQNKERGKDNQAKGNAEERERAARDMQTALNRVRDRMKNGATNVIAECRAVCKSFKPLTSRKDAMGRYANCEPLTGADGEEIQPETLAKNYRNQYGTKKAHKAKAAQPKRRTK